MNKVAEAVFYGSYLTFFSEITRRIYVGNTFLVQ